MHLLITLGALVSSILAIPIAAGGCSIRSIAQRNVVQTSRGSVVGRIGARGTRWTLPYAQPPTRFGNPVRKASFGTLYDASTLAPFCAQNLVAGFASESEDCLFLTIYAPVSATPRSRLATMVWVHGGTFVSGGSGDTSLDGSAFAERHGVIVVSVQYRLGLLGFLKSSDRQLPGNYGLKDLIMALQFVQDEISAFGGNNGRVLLAGQSSGAEMISTLLTIPSAASLYSNVALHSAPLNFNDQSPAVANSVAQLVLKDLNCTTITCLSTVPVSQILQTQSKLYDPSSSIFAFGLVKGVSVVSPVRTVVDSVLVQGKFGTLTRGGLRTALKPIIFTTTKDEGCQTIDSISQSPLPDMFFDPIVRNFLIDSRADAIINTKAYDPAKLPADSDSVRNSLLALASDYAFTCATQQSAINLTIVAPGTQVYISRFDMGISFDRGATPFCIGKVGHQDDIHALFGTSPDPLSAAQSTLSTELQTRWAQFAKTGAPNSPELPRWSPVTSTNLNLLVLGGQVSGSSVFAATQRQETCGAGGVWGNRVEFDHQKY